MEAGKCLGEIVGIELGPHPLGEMQFGIGRLPQQKVGEALLTAGADDEVDVAQVRVARNKLGKFFAARHWLARELGHGIEDRIARRIINGNAQMQRLAGEGRGLRICDRGRDPLG